METRWVTRELQPWRQRHGVARLRNSTSPSVGLGLWVLRRKRRVSGRSCKTLILGPLLSWVTRERLHWQRQLRIFQCCGNLTSTIAGLVRYSWLI